MKKLKKIVLKKETIANLEKSEMDGLKGGYATSTVCGNPTTETVGCVPTKGAGCDIPTIGHDENGCLSKTDWGWCWCYGQY